MGEASGPVSRCEAGDDLTHMLRERGSRLNLQQFLHCGQFPSKDGIRVGCAFPQPKSDRRRDIVKIQKCPFWTQFLRRGSDLGPAVPFTSLSAKMLGKKLSYKFVGLFRLRQVRIMPESVRQRFEDD